MIDSGARLVVAIATYQRAEPLHRTLTEVSRQAGQVGLHSRILVVDNDPLGSAEPIVAGFGGSEPPIQYVLEPSPGIAAARNRALSEAASDDLLVFIDDDERPCEGWLSTLVGAYFQRPSAAVIGPVISTFDTDVEDWISAGGFFERRRMPTGTTVARAATNNLLLDLNQIRGYGLRFDERFGLSGGSDSLFTSQLTQLGGVMRWCDEAVVVDHVPAERITRDWVLRRAMRYGNSASRTDIAMAASRAEMLKVRARSLGRGLARCVAGAGRYVFGRATGSLAHTARGQRTFMKGAGFIRGVFGSVYVEYARDEGSSRRARSAA